MDEKKNQERSTKLPRRYWINWIYLLVILGIIAIWFINIGIRTEITWKEFEEEILREGDVEKLEVVNNQTVYVYIKIDSLGKDYYRQVNNSKGKRKESLYFFTIGSADVLYQQLEKAQDKYPTIDEVPVSYSTEDNWLANLLVWLIPLGLFIIFWRYILNSQSGLKGRINAITNFGQSNVRISNKSEKNKKTFKDVAGLEEAKEEISELVNFLKDPEKYKKLGAKMPKGVLLSGPPGTGKTLLAKAVSGEAGVPFLSLSGSEFIEMFVGVGAARVRDLFKKAKSMAPSIIFIDEIDTIGRARGRANAFQSNDERESTLNQLLAELDGFDTDSGVIILAATNRGDILDPALLRPGRFDRHIYLELPNLKEREAIFKVHIEPLNIDPEFDLEMLAAQTPGFSGADIANICNEAALIAARSAKERVQMQDFIKAIDRVIGGLEKKSKIITPEEKKRIAYHESGHVITSWFSKYAPLVLKVSIIPRGKSLGSAWYIPEEHQIITKSEFFDNICSALGGRAAESILFQDVSSNALDDLEKATKLAYSMVALYGMSEGLPNLSYYDSTGESVNRLQKPYSEKTAEQIDKEVATIINQAYDRTCKNLMLHRKELDDLAELLVVKEILHKDEIESVLGKRN